jgi:hypothetical protein
MDNGMSPAYSFASGGSLALDGVTNVTPSNFVNWGGTGFNKPKGGGDEVSTTVTAAQAAVEAMAQPLIAGITAEITQQQVNLRIEVSRMTSETQKTNALLAALLGKTASEGGIARAVVGQGNKWNG